MEQLKHILSSPWFGGFAFLASLIMAIVLTVWSVRKGRRTASPRYWIKQTALLDGMLDQYPELAISYSGRAVKRFTMARIAFWNGGTATIRREDVARKSPVRIQLGVGDATILGSSVDVYGDNANDVKADGDPHGITIDFEFLDPQDGCVIRLFHDGPATMPIQIVGKIQGVRLLDDALHTSRFIARVAEWLAWGEPAMDRLPKIPIIGVPLTLVVVLTMIAPIMIVFLPLVALQGIANILDRQPQRFRR